MTLEEQYVVYLITVVNHVIDCLGAPLPDLRENVFELPTEEIKTRIVIAIRKAKTVLDSCDLER